MPTDRQKTANRANAQKSTGPRSHHGKTASARNSVRHGMTGQFQIMGPENLAEYKQLLAQLHEDHQPATVLESMLVERMAQHHWLILRAIRL